MSVGGRNAVLENELVSGHERVADLDHTALGRTSLADQMNHRRPGAECQFGRLRLGGRTRLQRLDELSELVPVVFESGVYATTAGVLGEQLGDVLDDVPRQVRRCSLDWSAVAEVETTPGEPM